MLQKTGSELTFNIRMSISIVADAFHDKLTRVSTKATSGQELGNTPDIVTPWKGSSQLLALPGFDCKDGGIVLRVPGASGRYLVHDQGKLLFQACLA